MYNFSSKGGQYNLKMIFYHHTNQVTCTCIFQILKLYVYSYPMAIDYSTCIHVTVQL